MSSSVRSPGRVFGPEPEESHEKPSHPAWNSDALAAMRSPDAEACGPALDALSAAVFNDTDAKALAGDAGALLAIFEGIGQHPFNAAIQSKGARCLRRVCLKNPLACASAAAIGVLPAITAAIENHPDDYDLHQEVIWALSTLALTYETCIVAASRCAYDPLKRLDATRENPKTIAMATFIIKKIDEWRCGNNR